MERVLVADTDEATWRVLTGAFFGREMDFQRVTHVRGLLKQLVTDRPDLLITEAFLPDGPAWEFLPAVHRIDPSLPVIVLTGDNTWTTMKRVRQEGAPILCYALKPVDVREIEKVSYYALRWRNRRMDGRLSRVPDRSALQAAV